MVADRAYRHPVSESRRRGLPAIGFSLRTPERLDVIPRDDDATVLICDLSICGGLLLIARSAALDWEAVAPVLTSLRVFSRGGANDDALVEPAARPGLPLIGRR
mgnify:CR=1 FL=1